MEILTKEFLDADALNLKLNLDLNSFREFQNITVATFRCVYTNTNAYNSEDILVFWAFFLIVLSVSNELKQSFM